MKPKKQELTLGHIACGMCRFNTGIEMSTTSDAIQHTPKNKSHTSTQFIITDPKGENKYVLRNVGKEKKEVHLPYNNLWLALMSKYYTHLCNSYINGYCTCSMWN